MPRCHKCGKDVPLETGTRRNIRTGAFTGGADYFRTVAYCPRCDGEEEDAKDNRALNRRRLCTGRVRGHRGDCCIRGARVPGDCLAAEMKGLKPALKRLWPVQKREVYPTRMGLTPTRRVSKGEGSSLTRRVGVSLPEAQQRR